MTTPTLEELAAKYLWKHADGNNYHGNIDQLRALITEAVGIVQDEVVVGGTGGWIWDKPLHHNDMERLK